MSNTSGYSHVYQLYCIGPFRDGRAGECWVRVGELGLNREAHPVKDLGIYRCSVCGTASRILRPYADRDLIPWWDPDYRAAVISALALPAQVFPHIKLPHDNKPVRKRFFRDQYFAVRMALDRLLSNRPAPKELSRMRPYRVHGIEETRRPSGLIVMGT